MASAARLLRGAMGPRECLAAPGCAAADLSGDFRALAVVMHVSMVEGVIPTCLALILCRAVVRRVGTPETVIVDAFEFFEAASLPIPAMPFTVWMQLRDGNGPTAMELVVEYLPPVTLEPEEIVNVRFSLNFSDPNAVLEHEAVFENGLPLEQVGRYRLRLRANGTTILQRYFGVFRSTK